MQFSRILHGSAVTTGVYGSVARNSRGYLTKSAGNILKQRQQLVSRQVYLPLLRFDTKLLFPLFPVRMETAANQMIQVSASQKHTITYKYIPASGNAIFCHHGHWICYYSYPNLINILSKWPKLIQNARPKILVEFDESNFASKSSCRVPSLPSRPRVGRCWLSAVEGFCSQTPSPWRRGAFGALRWLRRFGNLRQRGQPGPLVGCLAARLWRIKQRELVRKEHDVKSSGELGQKGGQLLRSNFRKRAMNKTKGDGEKEVLVLLQQLTFDSFVWDATWKSDGRIWRIASKAAL